MKDLFAFCHYSPYICALIKNLSMKSKLFQFAILWHPTEKQVKDEGLKSKVIVDLKTILANDQNSASMSAAMEIPSDYKSQLDQVEIAIRPF